MAEMEAEVMMEDGASEPRPQQEMHPGVVLVALDVNKDISTQALNWAFMNAVRPGDTVCIVGILSHVLNPMGYKCRLDENSWLGANRRILENELSSKRLALLNIEDLKECCEKAQVQIVIDVKPGLHPKMIVVEEAKKFGAHHVVLDRKMKQDRKYFIDNLTCFVTRVRNSGGVDYVRQFAIAAPGSSLSKHSSFNSSLRGSSMSSTTYNQDLKDLMQGGGPLSWRRQDSIASTGTTRSRPSFEFDRNRIDEPLVVANHDLRLSTTVDEPIFEIPRSRNIGDSHHHEPLYSRDRRLEEAKTPRLPHSSSLPVSKALTVQTCVPKTNPFSRSMSVDRVASGRIGSREKAAKSVWVWTSSKDVMMAAVETGWTTFVFTIDTKDLADDWILLAKIRPLYLDGGQIVDSHNRQVAALGHEFASGEQIDYLPSLMGRAEVVVMSALDSQVAAAERMVAAFLNSSTALYAVVNSTSDARTYLEALGKGTDGVVLHTDDPSQIYQLGTYLKKREETTMGVRMVNAMVTAVEPVGLGDRVTVDLCHLLQPGEGLLVGSFARALFLVHSECSDIDPTASRPFRVNAGPVHAYVGMAGGVTSYLSELHTGSQVLVVDAQGRSRTVLVGRVKIEQRPLLLVEVEVEGQRHSVLLQNSENVCLVTPGEGMNGKPVRVTSLKVGHSLLLNLQDEANDADEQNHPKHVVER
ncbi:uncharacterized protein [Physcomitrium patens]|nr:uncharacterized protein LOC112292584 isoform X1 [Physcomitrium patens]XP_024396971.1 uncharacterized protein LOC112292584 isoform X1 [Physcomitrium patens]XP_024396972.1 uncharacterized protein LOC112292584 isoform X1 [Physcomitrium patens]PNR39685.1 hypothetical protein PHYPA_019964 [Physcomitrium patens]|eukprot:XP_024396970.1 uncharacterized protein LOC112292584 isoform X1 [Physcomitrella patens]